MNTTPLAEQARLWQLISPTLPVGAFHYSQGLEAAVNRGWVQDEATARAWIGGLLRHTIASVDLPILVRVHTAWRQQDSERLFRWDQTCRACRETRELREEDDNMGFALRRLAAGLEDPVPDGRVGFVTAFAVVAANWKLSARDAAAGYAWSWCENQVASAVKLVPLGQTAGQRMLRAFGSALPGIVESALTCRDDEIGRGAPGLAIASSGHETQYSKLFRS